MTLLRHPLPFPPGFTPLTDRRGPTGLDFGILRLRAGQIFEPDPGLETALLLLDGRVSFTFDGPEAWMERTSLFDQDPIVLHTPPGTPVRVEGLGDAELALFQVENDRHFQPMIFDEHTLAETDQRGRGLLRDTSWRVVRCVFDLRNRPASNLVLGEVLTLPGRWSSYPPHHHDQPEIYHYRFTRPQGWGHAEAGPAVHRVEGGDTLLILDGADHPQVAAPGYGMYYLWAVRHLPGRPYQGFTYTDPHRWLTDPAAPVWHPQEDEP